MKQPAVLVVDDDAPTLRVLEEALREWGYRVRTATSGTEATGLVKSRSFDAVLVDLHLPDMDGLALLREIKRRDPAAEVVVMTGYPAVETAVQALKEGAYDYLPKPVRADELRHLMGRVTERGFLRQEVSTLRGRLADHLAVTELVGESAAMRELKATIATVAANDAPVLVEGESGTGKELVAAAIHRLSPRGQRPFIPVNCGAIPADLLESEFFGHRRGAFSGAVSDTAGLFRAAHGGTLFLDEVAELPTGLQVKLLRALEAREVRPVGSTEHHAVDVRIVAATNRDVGTALATGVFRQDLFYRLNVVRITLPPLRERKSDVPLLAGHFVRELNARFRRNVRGIEPEAMAALLAYDFPGNVRELKHVLERAYALGARERLTLGDLPLPGASPAPAPPEEVATLAQTELQQILAALRLHHEDKRQAARSLGISLRTIYRRLQQYGLR